MTAVISGDGPGAALPKPSCVRIQPPVQVMTAPWLAMWSFMLSLAWLMPIHFPPWSTFHADAWMALGMVVGATALVWRAQSTVPVHSLPLVIAVLVAVPWAQFGLGLLPFGGQAWMSSLYLLGFLLALLVGAYWETACPGQATRAIFMAIGIAALLSVWLQLYTWLGVWTGEITDTWTMGLNGARPYANMGQPNQLATLLLWALVALFWANLAGYAGKVTAILAACLILLGLALTQSRMGWLALTAILASIWFWRHLWAIRQIPWAASGLYVYFWLCPFFLKWLNSALLRDATEDYLRLNEQGELRLGALRLFAQAVLERPWLGYGWTDLSAVHLALADRVPGIGVVFGHSHNLLLDLLVWCGVPLGAVLIAFLLRWFWLRLRAVRAPQDAALFMVLCVVGIHAMVEFPLHYAHFLLPVGVVMGVLQVRLAVPAVAWVPRWSLAVLLLVAAMGLAVTVRDYFRVETSFTALRFELARINLGKYPPGKPPEVLALTQLRERIRFGRYVARRGMSEQELTWMVDIVGTFPTAGGAFHIATAMALNNRREDAARWLIRGCRITVADNCLLMERAWAADSRDEPALAAVPWPGR